MGIGGSLNTDLYNLGNVGWSVLIIISKENENEISFTYKDNYRKGIHNSHFLL